MAEASYFQIGIPLGFAKAHKKIPPKRINGCSPGLTELPKFVVLCIISAMAEACNFKFGMQLGFSMTVIKSDPEEKVDVPGLEELPKIRGSPLIFLHNLYISVIDSDIENSKK